MSQGQEKFAQIGLWWRGGPLNGAKGVWRGAGLLFCGVLGQHASWVAPKKVVRRPPRLLLATPVKRPQQESTTTTTSSTNYPANQSRWVTPLVFVQALAYVLHRVNRCRGRRDMVWDVEMLTVCESVCLLAGFPQEGYDPSVHLPAPVQVSRKRAQNRIWGGRHLTSASGSVTSWTSRPTVPSRRGKFPQRAAATNLDRTTKS